MKGFVMKKMLACKYLAALAMLGLMGAGPETTSNGSGGKVSLTSVTLAPTTVVVSPNHANALGPIVITNDSKSDVLTFTTKDASQDITLNDTKISVTCMAGKFILKSGAGTSQLQPVGVGLASVPLTVGKNQKYVLAFPKYSPTPKGFVLTYRSGGVQRGTINGQSIALFDDNTDGVYTMDDAIRVENGASAVAIFAPLTKYLATQKGVVEIKEVSSDGTSLTYAPYTGKTAKATVNLAVEPGAEVHTVWKSVSGDMSFIASSRNGAAEVNVVPGEYKMMYGIVYSLKNQQICAQIMAPKSTLTVDESGAAKIEMGKPFVMDFIATQKDKTINVSPSVIVRGKAGEVYQGIKFETLPEVALIVDNKAVMLGKMAFG